MRIEYELLAGYKNLVNVGSCICEWISTSWFCGEVSSNPIHTIMWQRWTFNQFALSTNICEIWGLLLRSKSTSSTSGQWTRVLTMACFVLQLWEASGSGNVDSPNCEVNFQRNACTFQDRLYYPPNSFIFFYRFLALCIDSWPRERLLVIYI